jgi:hypothetical protein
MLTEKGLTGNFNTGVFRFKLDGVVKTISGAVTGNGLYAVAGHPASLETVDGKKIPKNGDEIDFGGKEVELITKHSLGSADELNPEHTHFIGVDLANKSDLDAASVPADKQAEESARATA